jgi:hypothetical protein
MNRTIRFPLALGCSLAAVGCAGSFVRGRITDCRDSTPLQGADVQLVSQSPNAAWNATQTGSDGEYGFRIDAATKVTPVTLTAAKHGYGTVQRTYATVPVAEDVCLQPTIR